MSAENVLRGVPGAAESPENTQHAHPQDGLFEELIVSRAQAKPGVATRLLPLSLALHGVLGAAALIVPLLAEESLPEPQRAVMAFLVSAPPVVEPPPPPPPPPKAAPVRRASAPRPATTPVPSFVAPIEVPEVVEFDAALDLGVEGGVEGGVAGGVPGGVVGGVVGGLADLALPPPMTGPVRVGGSITEPKKLKDVSPNYPRLARQARVQGIVILEATVSPVGRVTDVTILRGIPMLNKAAIDAVRQWVYTPTLVDGIPVPVLQTVTVQFVLEDSRGA